MKQSGWKAVILCGLMVLQCTAQVRGASFTSNSLAVFSADANANNTSFHILELDASGPQVAPIQSIAINGSSGSTALRTSGSASSTGYLAESGDGTLLAFTGYNTTNSSGNANTVLARAVGTLDAAGGFTLQTVYTGLNGQQTRCASTLDGASWYIGDQNGFYSNGSSTPSPAGNYRSVKAFDGQVYVLVASATLPPVLTISAPTGGSTNGLPGLPMGNSNMQDFFLVASGSTGSQCDLLYVLAASSGSSGTIYKYSLVDGSWTANGSYPTTFGGFGLAAAATNGGALLYVTSGTGATSANSVMKLADTAGYNTTLAITTASNVTLYTGAAGTVMKGIAFAPKGAGQGSPFPVLAITNPATATLTVATGVASYDVAGTCSNAIGGLAWTNALTGVGGAVVAMPQWVAPGVVLGMGANVITVIATNNSGAVTSGVTITRSGSSAYTPVVQVGANVYQPFSTNLTPGTWVYLEADYGNGSLIHATQRSLGYREVNYKGILFAGLGFSQVVPATNGLTVTYDYTAQSSKKSYTVGYWANKDLPVMVGPDGLAYITDGHHTDAGYISAANTQVGDVVPGLHRVVLGHIATNFFSGTPVTPDDTWWTNRLAENNAFLYNGTGCQLQLPSDANYDPALRPVLPSIVPVPVMPAIQGATPMTNDHYRSLTWGTADGIVSAATNASGKIVGYSKTNPDTGADINFVEFFWADYLRNRVVWNDAGSGHPLGSGFSDANAISAPVSFFTAVANAIALGRSEAYRDQFGRGLLDYTNGASFNANTVTWATKSLANGSYPAAAGDVYNLFLLDDSGIAGAIAPSSVSVNRLHIDTAAGMVVSNRLMNLRDILINSGYSLTTSWKDAIVTNSTVAIPAGTGRVALRGSNSVPGLVQVAGGSLAVEGILAAGSLSVAPGTTLECPVGTSPGAVSVTGNLALNGHLAVVLQGVGAGTYPVASYGGTLLLSNANALVQSPTGYRATLDTNTAGELSVVVVPLQGGATILAGWDVSSCTNYGLSPLAATTSNGSVTVTGLCRGAGVGTNGAGNAASRAWGGACWTNADAASAIAAGRYASFTLTPAAGATVSFSAISRLDYRRSSTAASTALLQYQLGTGAFVDVTNLSYSVTNSSGGSLGPVDLTGIPALQSVDAPTPVTFRIVNFGGSASAGTWYVYDKSGSSENDLEVQGSVITASMKHSRTILIVQ